MIIFTRTYDFITWLIPKTENFPRSQRFIVTERLQQAALSFQELLVEANAQRGLLRLEKLRCADTELRKVRLYLRLCEKWNWLTPNQYHHVSETVVEIGKLLGGWQKTVTSAPHGAL
ncbi:MAG: diversity-generating retroelement protein Avd [Anaerolineaceae bacterium]|nr:diversity-generating retroelement protein Avd [Anaerolineaceae bacterium]